LAVIGVVTSVVGAFYYLRIVKIMFFDDAAEAFLPRERKTSVVMALSAAFVVLFVLPFIGDTLVVAAHAAAAVLAPAQVL
jgi:NADH-quinone oxidoreductase subunit N